MDTPRPQTITTAGYGVNLWKKKDQLFLYYRPSLTKLGRFRQSDYASEPEIIRLVSV